MKNLFLIFIMLIIIVFVYYIMTKIDGFIKNHSDLRHGADDENKLRIHIASDSAMLLGIFVKRFKTYFRKNMEIKVLYSIYKIERIKKKLIDGTLDIAVLTEKNVQSLDERYAMFAIPCDKEMKPESVGSRGGSCVFVVWNKLRKSKKLERILFAIEAEYYLLDCGYANYLD